MTEGPGLSAPPLVNGLERVSSMAGYLGAIAIVPLVVVLLIEVFSRYTLGTSTPWAHELSYMLMTAIFMLSLGHALRVRQHVSIDFLHGRLSERGKALADLLGYVLMLPLLVWMCIAIGQYAWRAYATGEVSGVSAWNPVIWPFRTVWFLGFVVLSVQVLAEMLKAISVVFAGRHRT